MGVYRGTTPLKAYKGDMQPVNIYKGSTKVAGWHSASYSGASPLTVDCDYNVPPDALTVDGKCAQVAGSWGTNLITNGDFLNGTTGWVKYAVAIAASGGKLDVVADTSTGGHYSDQLPSSPPVVGHRYYGRVYCEPVVGKACALMYNRKADGAYEQLLPPGLASAGVSSVILQVSSVYSTPKFIFRLLLMNSAGHVICAGEEARFSHACLIDLTAAFGAGKEPTVAQMDAMMAQFPNSWFDGSNLLSTDTATYTANSPSPSFPATISTITGNMAITGADGAASDTVTVAIGSAVCASLPDGTHDSYDAVTGVLTKRVGKYVGASGTSWTINDAAVNAIFMSDRIPAGTMSGQTVTSSAVCAPTIYYALATPAAVQLTPHLPVVRTGIKTLSVGADVVPTISATVKSMD